MPKQNSFNKAEEIIISRRIIQDSGCWIYNGTKNKNKYGIIGFSRGKRYLVHRLFWELKNGKIPKDIMVCHSCDVRDCFNPNHLFLGTQSENMKDAYKKGRVARGKSLPHTKLCESDILKIKSLRGVLTQRKISIIFGVRQDHISRIQNGRAWSYI